jgi:hypothetical protein
VVNTMAQYENLFVNLMITEERGLIIPRETEFELCTDALIMFIAFAFFGSLPLLTYWICDALLVTSDTHAFLIAVFAGLAMLAAFGCIKGSFRYGKHALISVGDPLYFYVLLQLSINKCFCFHQYRNYFIRRNRTANHRGVLFRDCICAGKPTQ